MLSSWQLHLILLFLNNKVRQSPRDTFNKYAFNCAICASYFTNIPKFVYVKVKTKRQVRPDNNQVQKALMISLWFCLFSLWNCMILQCFPCKECLVFPVHKHPALPSGFWSYHSFPENFKQIKLFPVCCFSFTHIDHVQICFNGLWVLHRS